MAAAVQLAKKATGDVDSPDYREVRDELILAGFVRVEVRVGGRPREALVQRHGRTPWS